MEFLRLIALLLVYVGGGLFLLFAVIFPILRYIVCRIFLFIRCLFCRAEFSEVGFMRCLIPHFGDKPDILLLSGKNLYAIKLISFRKTKKTVVFASDKYWEVENIIPNPPSDNEGAAGMLFVKWHELRVFRHTRRAPYGLIKYTANINKALADEKIDCVPVYLFSPSVKQLRTLTKVDMLNGDTTFYGVVVGNGFYPDNAKRSDLDAKESRRIMKTAKKALRVKLPKERKGSAT